jgi:hypothetical protein
MKTVGELLRATILRLGRGESDRIGRRGGIGAGWEHFAIRGKYHA